MESYASPSSSQFLRVLLSGFLSRLLLWWVEGGVKGCHRSFLSPSVSAVCSHQCHGKSSFLALYNQWEHGSQTYTWFLETTQTTDIHIVSLWCQHVPQTSASSLGTAYTTDINTALGLCAGCGHHHSPRPTTSTWPQGLTHAKGINRNPSCSKLMDPDMVLSVYMTMDINMASGGCTGHSHQQGPRWQHDRRQHGFRRQHRPRTSVWS